MSRFGGHTMSGALQRVLVCAPDTAGWRAAKGWRELGYHHEPDARAATRQHEALIVGLDGVEVLTLEPSEALSLDAVYAHDASFPTDYGMILMHMGKASRRDEADVHQQFFEAHDIDVLGRIEAPGLTEAGDMIWLDASTVLVGEGFRTNAEGIAQLRRLLEPHEVTVLASPLPYGPGPNACLHLMSLISILDKKVALVDRPWLSVSTVRLLEQRGFELVLMADEERDSLACNVLALGNKKLLAIAENQATNARLENAGFAVSIFPGSEISANGSGGPTCLTRPLLRS